MNASVSVVEQIAWVWNLLLQWAENWVTSYLVTLNSPPRHSVRINIKYWHEIICGSEMQCRIEVTRQVQHI